MDGLGWVWWGGSCTFTWFGSVGDVILGEKRVRGEIDGEAGVGCRVD